MQTTIISFYQSRYFSPFMLAFIGYCFVALALNPSASWSDEDLYFNRIYWDIVLHDFFGIVSNIKSHTNFITGLFGYSILPSLLFLLFPAIMAVNLAAFFRDRDPQKKLVVFCFGIMPSPPLMDIGLEMKVLLVGVSVSMVASLMINIFKLRRDYCFAVWSACFGVIGALMITEMTPSPCFTSVFEMNAPDFIEFLIGAETFKPFAAFVYAYAGMSGMYWLSNKFDNAIIDTKPTSLWIR